MSNQEGIIRAADQDASLAAGRSADGERGSDSAQLRTPFNTNCRLAVADYEAAVIRPGA